MAGSALLDQLLNGLTIGMVYVLLAAGLSIIFGVMEVINFAHGELFALGAYFAFGVLAAGAGEFWLALLVAPVGVAVVAAAMERFTVRPLYGRNPLYHILLTFGLVLVFKDVIEAIWGSQPRPMSTPDVLAGPVSLAGYSYSTYNLFVIAVGALLAGGAWLALNHTKYGLIVRAGSMDRDMVRYLGIDVDRYYTLVFAFGALLAAFGGIVLAGRNGSVGPGMGDSVIIPAFVVVVIGGLGSFRGAVVAGLGVGVVQTLMRSYVPVLEGLVVFLLMIVVLLVRPQGLFGAEFEESGGELLTVGDSVLTPERRRQLGIAAVALLAVAPLGVGRVYTAYMVNSLLVGILAWALFALSLDFVMGYAGLVSLGHVLFYGVGAYTTMLVGMHLLPSVFVALALGVLVCLPIAWVIGQLSIRVSGVYFAMVTLGFAELFAQIPFKTAGINSYLASLGGLPSWVRVPALHGENGIVGVDFVYGLSTGPEVGTVEVVADATAFYYLALVALVASYLLARQLMAAPFGRVLHAIRESERRAAFVGYDVTAYKRRAFVVSGGLAGLAGGIQAITTGSVAPGFLAWIKSGEVIVMTMLGGIGTLYGPMLGAGVFLGVKELLLSTFDVEQWQGVLGVLFVLFVIFVPEGLVSLPGVLVERFSSRSGGGGPAATVEDREPDTEVTD